MEGGEFGPLRARELFHHLLHGLLFDAFAEVRFLLAGRGPRLHICFVDLPFNVGSAVESFAGKGSGREDVIDAVVKSQGVLGRAAATGAAACLLLRIAGSPEQNPGALATGRPDDAPMPKAAPDRLTPIP